MKKALGIAVLALLLNTAYVAAWPSATVFYMGNVVVHLVLGAVVAAGLFLIFGRALPRGLTVLAAIATAFGVYLAVGGATRPHRWALIVHVGAAALALIAALPWLTRQVPRSYGWMRFHRAYAACAAVLLLVPAGVLWYRHVRPDPAYSIRNPLIAPASMEEEGAGPSSPFWPSSAKSNTGTLIRSDFFMDSKSCSECHHDIYEQWNSSMHHFASFNNQFYRKSIEYMQSLSGTHGSKWCAGCHDHAMFFNGRFEKPAKDQIDTPQAQTGLGCMSCHSIVHVAGSMGNGGITIEYPPLHELANSSNPYLRAVNHFLTYLNPEPHRRTFLKPFMRESVSEYCSGCHKVHLDIPVNHYRWQRGFNDYDNWQASGVSGQGARSFYYPAKSSTCADCHMPLVRSNDPGARDGQVHSHRFAAANSAVAYANQDERQLKEVEKFLQSGFITVDIFAASPVEDTGKETGMVRRTTEGPQLQTTFAVGEEAEQAGNAVIREVGRIAAPLNAAGTRFLPGSTVRVDTVVRTRKIGHFFPGGTVDAFDVWLELQGRDADGRTVFWSGSLEDNGKGPVERGAHFYRSYLLDGEGNHINKRNAFQARSVLYVRLIPPGAADVAHFRVKIPRDARGPITLTAKLNYRKFSHFYTQFSYAGEPKPEQPASLAGVAFDNREFSFDPANLPANVSGKVKGRIPDLPVITLATAQSQLPLGTEASEWRPMVRKQDRERWNDWGIGLLLQGDLKGAEYAFRRVTEAEPGYADGWLNVARALIQEGETDAAKPFVAKALELDPKLARIHFFRAMIQKADGDYDGALASLRTAAAQYPRDRVVQNQIGRILFLKREYASALDAIRQVLAVDPEDVQGHYTAMLCFRGLGQTAEAEREQVLFRRFKADESSQSITAKARMLSPEDNNERQPIHDHDSAISIPVPKAASRRIPPVTD